MNKDSFLNCVINHLNLERLLLIAECQTSKYLNNIIEQYH